MIAEAIYLVGIVTSITCAFLLLRSFCRSRVRLLLWSGLAFVGFALNNVLLYVDMLVVPETDLSALRLIPSVAGLGLLCYGLIWETT
ncbi:MAG: DUF5985 family protein [Vulcanimicrobiaceae bacterium]